MNKNKKIILGLIVGIPLLIGTLSASHPTNSSVKSAATSRDSQNTISPVKNVTVSVPTITPIPTATPKPTATPVPTKYIAPTAVYVAPTNPPAQTYQQPATNNACAGATAVCADGSCSYSAHHQGTCSHHGGVTQWL